MALTSPLAGDGAMRCTSREPLGYTHTAGPLHSSASSECLLIWLSKEC